MIKLKPCPFCGASGTVHQKPILETWIAECTNNKCPASYMIGWDFETEEEATEAWNRRVNE